MCRCAEYLCTYVMDSRTPRSELDEDIAMYRKGECRN